MVEVSAWHFVFGVLASSPFRLFAFFRGGEGGKQPPRPSGGNVSAFSLHGARHAFLLIK